MKIILILSAFLLSFISSFSQKQANHWYFGTNCSLDFTNPSSPTAVFVNFGTAQEGCASISDKNGNLLFYTEGENVLAKNSGTMVNGTAIGGFNSSTQSCLIVPQPGNDSIYYVFTTDGAEHSLAGGFRYSVISTLRQGGMGEVLNKNNLIYAPCTEKLTAVKHKNTNDVWVITHEWNSDVFRAYLITCKGLDPNYVSSHSGTVHEDNGIGNPYESSLGYMRTSPDGTKLALAMRRVTEGFYELFDFDNSTGVVSNPVKFSGHPLAYGVEFSPDSKKLYGTRWTDVNSLPGKIYQFDLTTGDSNAIANSGQVVATSSSSSLGALQIGPNGKIYVTRWSSANDPISCDYIGIINNPNILGTSCNYVDNGILVQFGTIGSKIGLPNFITSYFDPSPAFSLLVNTPDSCVNSAVEFSQPDFPSGYSFTWDFGDPDSGSDNTSVDQNPGHVYSSAGTFAASIILNNTCSNDTLQTNVTIYSCEDSLMIPNIFSPNDDGKNDFFKITGSGIKKYKLEIFNRWGEEVYNTDDISQYWDGKSRSGSCVPDGTYYYVASAEGYSGKDYSRSNFLTLVR